MGGTQSALGSEPLPDLEVLGPGKPLSVLLQSSRNGAGESAPPPTSLSPPSSPAPATPTSSSTPSQVELRPYFRSPPLTPHKPERATTLASPVSPLSHVARPDRALLSPSSSSIPGSLSTMTSPSPQSPRHRPMHYPSPSRDEQHNRRPRAVADSPTTASLGAADALSLPRDPDHDFWSALFRDYVIFDRAAQPQHRSAFRVLSTAAKAPRGAVANDVALVFRAAVCRVRDYVAAPTASFGHDEVLGALLLAARVLSALADTNPSDRTLCLILGAVSVDFDATPHLPTPIPVTEAMDIGQSVLWQLLTSALDCVAHRDGTLASPGIVLAAINVVFVALSTTYLAPRDHDPRIGAATSSPPPPPPSPTPSSYHSFADEGIEFWRSSPGLISGSSSHSINSAALLNATPVPVHSLLTSIVDRYPRPGGILAALLDFAGDAASQQTSLSVPLGLATYSGVSTPGPANHLSKSSSSGVYSASMTANAMVASLSKHLQFGPSAQMDSLNSESTSATAIPKSASAFSTSSVMSALTSRLSGSNLFFTSPSVGCQDGNNFSPPDVSNDLVARSGGGISSSPKLGSSPADQAIANTVGDQEDSKPSSELYAGVQQSARGFEKISSPSPKTFQPHLFPETPTLLAEQALALLAVLCAPRQRIQLSSSASPQLSILQELSRASTRADGELQVDGSVTGAGNAAAPISNPYRAALLSLHDLPIRNIGDDSAYSFGRLYEILSAWIGDPRGALVAYYLINSNRRFRTFVLARTDPDVILVPLLASMHFRSSSLAPPAPADAYIPSIIALILTSDTDFCAAIDEINVPQTRISWYEDRTRLVGKGVSLSSLVMLVCIRLVQQSVLARRRNIESYLASVGVSIMANVSCSVSGMNGLAADRLVALVEFVGKRRRKSVMLCSHEMDGGRNGSEPVCEVFGYELAIGTNEDSELVSSVHNQYPSSAKRDNKLTSPTPKVSGKTPSLTLESQWSQGLTNESLRVFQLCGFEMSEADCIESLAELLGTILEIVASVLRCRSNVAVNRHLMYALLHRESIFEASHISEVSLRTRVVARHIRAVISFFSSHIDENVTDSVLPDLSVREGMGQGVDRSASESSLSKAQISGSGGYLSLSSGISVDRVFSVIDRYSRKLPYDTLNRLPKLQFEFHEADCAQEFFLTYSWILALRSSTMHWDPSQFPDARVPLSKSVFNPPRPPHGSLGSPTTEFP